MFKSSSGVVKEKSSVPRPRIFNMPRLALGFYPGCIARLVRHSSTAGNSLIGLSAETTRC